MLNILKQSSDQSRFKLIISYQTLIKLRWFFCLYNNVHFNGKRLAVFWNSFFSFKVVLAKNAKIDFFLKRKWIWKESSFYKIDV